MWETCWEKGGIIGEWYLKEGRMRRRCAGINPRLTLPNPLESGKIKKLIPSPLAESTYFALCKKFSYVFPEQVFAAFVEFDLVKNDLGENERRWFFTRRVDFVCCDEDFRPACLVEYNGKHHWDIYSTSKESRDFKKKVASLIGLPYIEINSPDQIKEIEDLSKEDYCA